MRVQGPRIKFESIGAAQLKKRKIKRTERNLRLKYKGAVTHVGHNQQEMQLHPLYLI